MNVSETVALLKAIAELLGVLVWPAVFLFVLVRFAPSLRGFFENLSELTFKAAGMEASAKRRQVEVAAALGAAAAMRAPTSEGEGQSPQAAAQEIAEVVRSATAPKTLRRIEDATVLWVDDNPTNNVYQRRSLEALGIEVEISPSTDDALERLARRSYDVVISDMGRPPDPMAGYTLLDALRARGDRTPFVIYSAGGSSRRNRETATQRGAFGSTDRAQELLRLVVSAISGR